MVSYLKRVELDDIRHTRSFVRDLGDAKKQLYGFSRYSTAIISELEMGHATPEDYKVGFFDIETTVSSGGIDAVNCPEEINMITFIDQDENITCFSSLDIKEEDIPEDIRNNMNLILTSDEEELLRKFVNWFSNENFDIISGWNSETFDIPYICKRITFILGKNFLEKLSPFGHVSYQEKEDDFNNIFLKYTIRGVTHIDMKKVYQKFIFSPRPSYSLDVISNIELGVGKLVHESGIPGHLLYRSHPTAGLHYNIVDVQRLKQISDKCSLD